MKFNELSFPFVMDLYRAKVRAEKNKDEKAVESLYLHYPELFSEEFAEFIESAKIATAYIDQKYNENFSKIFELEDETKNILH